MAPSHHTVCKCEQNQKFRLRRHGMIYSPTPPNKSIVKTPLGLGFAGEIRVDLSEMMGEAA